MQSKRDLWLLSGATLLIHLTCLTQYGWFRNELYYVACSHHLDWGYVDQPPMIALVAWIARHLFGESLWGIRLVSAFPGACSVFLTAMLARRMGGNRFAQRSAALCSMIARMYLAAAPSLSRNVL